MITGILEFENFLPNPCEVVELARASKFYCLANHPKTIDKTDVNLSWAGKRSDSLYVCDQGFAHSLFDRIFSRLTAKVMGGTNHGMHYEYLGNSSFHYLTAKDVRDDAWTHSDDGCVFAGILYLNKYAPDRSGTIVMVDGKEVEIKNEFNKLVLYPAHLPHYAQGGFGSDISDARLTIVFFVTAAMLKITCNSQGKI